MKATEIHMKSNNNNKNQIQSQMKVEKTQKPSFRPAQDDTKPALQDPILRSDPIETEEAVLRLPPASTDRTQFRSS
ncbi:Mitochondrial distribution and morphology protein 34 [Melia azedarach]|uniref:Mitochondrial distribution and morphology protein 34 n=1 Tax=Melia azedarach TaxID=155640 RepID=A0ACC1YM16_MELAZ|nr:Mitochondrial distribution and morphology protein 34 [Melia azedarach]